MARLEPALRVESRKVPRLGRLQPCLQILDLNGGDFDKNCLVLDPVYGQINPTGSFKRKSEILIFFIIQTFRRFDCSSVQRSML
jgi:hypothetical protein